MSSAKTEREKAQRTIAENRKARHDYHILDTWEAGIALLGTEVKSIREGRVNLRDSYARIDNGFNNAGFGFSNGDFDYNGVINFDDYSIIDHIFNTQSGPL